MCTKRAQEAGKEMANILEKRIHGRRPVSLIGCSTGTIVIWNCLKELAKLSDGGKGIISGLKLNYALSWT